MEKQFVPTKMNENFNNLKARILDILDSSDLDKICEQFKQIQDPTIFIGSGGSSVSAKFLANMINTKNECISEFRLPDELMHMTLRPYKNIFAVSYSGLNHGAKTAGEYAKQAFNKEIKAITCGKNYDPENNIVYSHTLPSEDSFISFAATLAPMALGLVYYIGDQKKAKNIIAEIFEEIENNVVKAKPTKTVEFVGKELCPAAAAFVESTLTESSIATAVTSGRYECHGRTTSVLQQEDRQMLLFTNLTTENEKSEISELDNMLIERLSDNGVEDRITIFQPKYNDNILNDFYATVSMMYWAKDLATQVGIDLSAMTNEEGKRIHLTADDKAIEIWEREHGRGFYDGRPDWKVLTKKDDSTQKGPGYYAPTGKFFEGNLGSTGNKMRQGDITKLR